MSAFFKDINRFIQELESTNEEDQQGCCGCSTGDRRLMLFNIDKDLAALGVTPQGCWSGLALCPRCSVRYMNSFNELLAKTEGRPFSAPRWTVKSYLAFVNMAMFSTDPT